MEGHWSCLQGTSKITFKVTPTRRFTRRQFAQFGEGFLLVRGGAFPGDFFPYFSYEAEQFSSRVIVRADGMRKRNAKRATILCNFRNGDEELV